MAANSKLVNGLRGKLPFFFFLIVLLMFNHNGEAQGLVRKFLNLHYPEKLWVLRHPFIVRKAFRIAQDAQKRANEMRQSTELDGDYSGGQVDAFRHCYWMAKLSASFGDSKSLDLGKAHEKGNRLDYEEGKLEEENLPDSVSSEMDLRNNRVGVEIGQLKGKIADDELAKIVIEHVKQGKLWMIKKDKQGIFLNWEGKALAKEDYVGKWFNDKILVPSDFQRPE